jgi:short-chain fatty acids transporter
MFFVNLMQKYLPDPFTIAWLITLVVCAMALVLTPAGPMDIIDYWGKNFFGILPFAMQMVLLLVSGYALAAAPQVRKLLVRLVRLAKSPRQVILLVAVTSMVLFWLNWGLGLIAAAFLAREAAKLNPNVDMRTIVAAGFSGIILTNGGLSGSVPLLINTPGHFLEKQIGLIGLDQTIFYTQNIVIVISLAIIIPLVCVLMLPKPEQAMKVDPALLEEDIKPQEVVSDKLADRLDHSRVLNYILVLMGFIYVIRTLYNNNFNLNLNILIFTFVILGLALQGSLIQYARAIGKGATTCSGIILQFPFYAGIMGIMAGSGLVNLISQGLINLASVDSYQTICYFSSLIISIFVPSAGGHWVVQAPFMLPPAFEMGVPIWKVAMGVTWGENIWNVVCPFWALPLLAIAKISLRDLIGSTVLLFVVGNVIVVTVLHLIPN